MTLTDLMMKVMKGVSLHWRRVKFFLFTLPPPSDGCSRFNNRSARLSSGRPPLRVMLSVINSRATPASQIIASARLRECLDELRVKDGNLQFLF